MITLTDVISAYSTLEGKIYPNINVWYGPYDSLNSAIQYIENICTQIGRSKVKGITVAVEENGTLVEYWNPTNANIFIKKHDTSIIDPATTTTTTTTKYPCIPLTNSTNQTFTLYAPIADGSDYQEFFIGETAYIKQDDSVQTISLSNSMLDMKSADITIRVYTAESSYKFYQFEKKEGVIEIDFATLISNKNITRVIIEGTFNVAPTTTAKPSNIVYYGVIKGYMDPNSFCSIPINKLIDRSETKFKHIIGDSVNEFTIPQDGYFSYLIIPVDKVELQYAAFTSGGLTSTYYDSSKPNTPTALDPTPNGAYYSKYTRGETAPYNKGGSYKGIDYDVYFAYINSGSIPEMINIKAKNK